MRQGTLKVAVCLSLILGSLKITIGGLHQSQASLPARQLLQLQQQQQQQHNSSSNIQYGRAMVQAAAEQAAARAALATGSTSPASSVMTIDTRAAALGPQLPPNFLSVSHEWTGIRDYGLDSNISKWV
jgi:hypothetical protein